MTEVDPVERTLDRRAFFDERSRAFGVVATIEPTKPRSMSWSVNTWLDQGSEGACVGFAVAHDLSARPAIHPATDWLAQLIYREAKKVDAWAGEAYEGTSVLAGVKVAQRLGHFAEYRWAFGLNDLILALGYKGPAVLGVNWYEGMFDTDADGYVRPTGDIAGGHAILARRVNIPGRFVELHNSWGKGWGVNGRARISFDDLDRLLHEDGEACIPVARR